MLTTGDCDSANQSSAAQVAVMISSYVQKTFIFSVHSAAACSEDCPWDSHVTHNDAHRANAETQADPHTQTCTRSLAQTDRHKHKHTHTLDSFTVRDKWCLTLWPGEMGWLSSSEMKILLTKVPWAKQVVSLGNLVADFCSWRATCQSKHPPNNHSESWWTLSARHKLVDWQLNGRMCSGHFMSSRTTLPSFRNKSGIVQLLSREWTHYRKSLIFMNIYFIFNCWSQCLPLILLLTKTDVSSGRYRGLLMWCLSFVLRNNSSCSSGASQRCGSPRNRQEGRTIHNVQRPIPLRMGTSVSQRAPLWAPGSRATPVRQGTTEAAISSCKVIV